MMCIPVSRNFCIYNQVKVLITTKMAMPVYQISVVFEALIKPYVYEAIKLVEINYSYLN